MFYRVNTDAFLQLPTSFAKYCYQTHIAVDQLEQLTRGGFKVDYVELLNQRDLEPATQSDRQLLIAAAAWLGKPRLLDNLEIELALESH